MPAKGDRETVTYYPPSGHSSAQPSVHPRAMPRVAIIGAGCIGLSIAWRLAAAGGTVDIYDRGTAGRGATHAAAGMLAAAVETEPGEQALLPLTLDSQRRWPAFAAELEACSGLSVDLRTEGTVQVALTRDDVEVLRSGFEFQRGLGLNVAWLTGAQVKEREPWLNPRAAAGVLGADDGQVDNRKLALALKAAAVMAGARLHEGAAVEALSLTAGRVDGVVVGGALRPADVVVLAAGAWSRQLAGLPEGAVPPVRPVKGQMLALRMDPARPLLRHVVWPPRCYLVPRLDGRLIVGATTEDKGWDDHLTAGGVLALLEAAWRALPGVEELPIEEMWVGHRPGSRDDAPILGPVPDVAGLVMATGHHRNGILLTPGTADLVANHILTGRVDPLLAPFGIGRFQQGTELRARA
ncbi:glycine oxidase ThiO [Nitrospirillum sp. BR 11164]|uniref:glycine oxidase ThiO n=1 Tax=Nitrospirillum sp. BR 11164 TaxID=3104324 RepID=UPI002AFF8CF1|nr:glycine oxidase ThiO [Nitrospirillum sp. BR 11164]MEA1649907.1 glycine oxidase ThiO [Nitrospirillum sp. BR 11164]